MSEVIALQRFRRPEAGEVFSAGSAANVPADTVMVVRSTDPRPTDTRAAESAVFFDRREFNLILNLYARMVGQGEWRDYAIGHDRESCSFAVFRRTADGALYRIVKTPKLARKQGAFSIVAQGGRIVRRGGDLAVMLRFFEPKREATL
ncbi:MAG: DUF2794 domain-containing protein [Ferrovibrio sp.]|jgi:hypothetical protein